MLYCCCFDPPVVVVHCSNLAPIDNDIGDGINAIQHKQYLLLAQHSLLNRKRSCKGPCVQGSPPGLQLAKPAAERLYKNVLGVSNSSQCDAAACAPVLWVLNDSKFAQLLHWIAGQLYRLDLNGTILVCNPPVFAVKVQRIECCCCAAQQTDAGQ